MERIIVFQKSIPETQKVLNQWLSQGYDFEILSQIGTWNGDEMFLITTIKRSQKEGKNERAGEKI